jgi:hypothetical protein
MAVANTKSAAITNMDATPPVLNNRSGTRAPAYIAVQTLETAAADDDNSVYRFFRLPSNAKIYSIAVLNDAITSGTSWNCGLWDTAANGGAVVDADLFASAVDLSAGTAAWLELRFEAATSGPIEYADYELWRIADLGAATYTVDPQKEWDLCLQGVTVGSSASTITLRIIYSC